MELGLGHGAVGDVEAPPAKGERKQATRDLDGRGVREENKK